MYEVWFPSLEPYADRPLILVGDEPSQLDAAFDTREVGPVREIVGEEDGGVVWRVYIRVVGPVRKPGSGGGG
jgi:hypothetical protein